MSYIILEFPVEYSKDEAVKDVRNLIDETKQDLPSECRRSCGKRIHFG